MIKQWNEYKGTLAYTKYERSLLYSDKNRIRNLYLIIIIYLLVAINFTHKIYI